MSILNDKIKELRMKNGYTLLQLSKLLNVKEATAQRYESGEIKNIKYDTVVKLANIFHCSPSYLMGWDDTTNANPNISTKFNLELAKAAVVVAHAYECADPRIQNAVCALLELPIPNEEIDRKNA